MLVKRFEFCLKVCIAEGRAIVCEIALDYNSPLSAFSLKCILQVDGMVRIQGGLELNVHESGSVINKDCITQELLMDMFFSTGIQLSSWDGRVEVVNQHALSWVQLLPL